MEQFSEKMTDARKARPVDVQIDQAKPRKKIVSRKNPPISGKKHSLHKDQSEPVTVNSIIRAFSVLNALLARDGSTVGEVASEADLPRATTYRILETLKSLGYVEREEDQGAFFIAPNVQGLSETLYQKKWINTLAKPIILRLGREVKWPVALAVPRKNDLVMRLATDIMSPMIETRFKTGTTMPLLKTAAGQARLAFSPTDVREALLAAILNHPIEKLRCSAALIRDFKARLPAIQAQGYAYVAIYPNDPQLKRTSAFAVPIMRQQQVIGCLSMRFYASALMRKDMEQHYVPLFQAAAKELGTES